MSIRVSQVSLHSSRVSTYLRIPIRWPCPPALVSPVPVLMASAVCIQRHTHLLGPVPGCVQDRLKLRERLGHCWGAAPPCCSLLSFRQGGLGCALRSARGILHFPKGSMQIRKRGHRTWSCEHLTLALEPRKLIIYGMSLCPLDFTKLGPPFTHKP